MPSSVCPPRRMRYSLESRARIVALVLAGASPQAAAAACGASRATGYRLWRRYREGGWAALADRAPIPLRQPRRLAPAVEQEILAARAYAKAGPLVVGALLGRPASTVWKVLKRNGASRLRLPAREPVRRYERERPGELLHVDIKRLGRFWTVGKAILGDGVQRSRRAGWHYLHLAIDDHSARLGRRLRRARDRPTLHPPAPPADQREGRGAREDAAARVGLSLRLPLERPPRPRSPWLPALVQQAPTPQLARRPTADQPCLTGLWVPHLGS
jgi:transposase